MKNILTVTLMKQYESHLLQEEKSVSTQKQYRREILRFLAFVSEKKITKELVIQYKKELMDQYQPVSVNTKLAAVNGFLSFAGYGEYRVKQLKIQRKPYCSSDRELTKAEYTRLLQSAKTRARINCGLFCRRSAEWAYEFQNFHLSQRRPCVMERQLFN